MLFFLTIRDSIFYTPKPTDIINHSNENPNNRHWMWLPTLFAVFCCGFVVVAHPSNYGFYTVTRIAVTLAAFLLVYHRYTKLKDLDIICLILALVFNPFFTLNLARELWVVADFVAIAVLMFSTLQAQKIGK